MTFLKQVLFSTLFLILLSATTAGASGSASAARRASSAAVTRFVSPAGSDTSNDCSSSAAPCQTVQHALAAAQAGDEIHVAAGAYTGSMFDGGIDSGVTAVLIISKNIAALRGGYAANFSGHDPATFPTVLSASGTPGAYVLVINGTATIVDGFTLSGSAGACSPGCGTNYFGAGVRLRGGTPTLSSNLIENNVAHDRGGGIYVENGAVATITGNVIFSNSTNGSGGGIYVQGANATISNNQILANTAGFEGGGVYIEANVPAFITGNAIGYNQATNQFSSGGAGVRTIGGSAVVRITHNDVFSNTIFGGGAGLDIGGPAIVDANSVHHNYLTAGGWGGAILVGAVTLPVTVTNNVLYANHGSAAQSVNSYQVAFVNNTVADTVHVEPNSGTEADAYLIWFDPPPSGPINMTVYNNILANNQNCGLFYHNAPGVISSHNEVWNNAANYCEGASAGAGDITANPLFANPAAGDYHLLPGSPALNVGTSTQAPDHDKDCAGRPYGPGFDLGAYELRAVSLSRSLGGAFVVFLPVIENFPPPTC